MRFDLVAVVSRSLDTHSPRIGDAGLALKREFPLNPLIVLSDRDAVEQIVLNLIENACKYAGEGGEICLSIKETSGGGAELRRGLRRPPLVLGRE